MAPVLLCLLQALLRLVQLLLQICFGLGGGLQLTPQGVELLLEVVCPELQAD